jgi:eukaryotic-like serine/threonine-protein kinase
MSKSSGSRVTPACWRIRQTWRAPAEERCYSVLPRPRGSSNGSIEPEKKSARSDRQTRSCSTASRLTAGSSPPSGPGANADIWVLDTGRDVANRLTAGHGIHINPVWSPNGRTILFNFGAPFNIFRINADGGGAEERVTQSPANQYISDWSHDGRFITYDQATADTGYDLWTLDVTPEGRTAGGAGPKPYVRAPFDQTEARFSPDNRWVAYESNDSGRAEIYIQAFPNARDKFPVSIGGGTFPEWGEGGRELYYVSNDRKLMAVALAFSASGPQASRPRELFPVPPTIAGAPFAAAADGRRFLTTAARSTSQPLTVVVNWAALMKPPPVSR